MHPIDVSSFAARVQLGSHVQVHPDVFAQAVAAGVSDVNALDAPQQACLLALLCSARDPMHDGHFMHLGVPTTSVTGSVQPVIYHMHRDKGSILIQPEEST